MTQRIVDIFHPLGIKVLDHIIVSSASYTSMAERGEVTYQCKSKADYEVITLSANFAKEKRNRFQYTHSR